MTPEERAAQRLLNLRSVSPPVDVEKLASSYADLEYVDLPVTGDAVAIRTAYNLKRPLILLNKSQANLARRRFTIAHEIGHLAMGWHSGTFACHVSESDVYVSGDYGVVEAEANRFASELLMPTPWVQAHVQKSSTIEEAYKGLKEKADVSYEAARIKLLANLPPGYVCMVEGGPGTKLKIECSPRTPLGLYLDSRDWLDASSAIAALDRRAIDGCEIPRSQRPIRWWRLDCRCEVPETFDERPSTTILRDLLQLYIENIDVVRAKERRINGLVGSANGRVNIRDRESLFGALKLRFGRRDLLTDPDLHSIIEHSQFEVFLVAKATELASGNNVAQKRK